MNFREVSFYAEHTTTGRRRTDVDEEQLALGELRDLGLLLVLSFDSEKSTEQEQADLKLCSVLLSKNVVKHKRTPYRRKSVEACPPRRAPVRRVDPHGKAWGRFSYRHQ